MEDGDWGGHLKQVLLTEVLNLLRLPAPARMRPRTGAPWGPCEGSGFPLAPDWLRGKELAGYAAGEWTRKAAVLTEAVTDGYGVSLIFGADPYRLFAVSIPPEDEDRAGKVFRGAASVPDGEGRMLIFCGSTHDGEPEGREGAWTRDLPPSVFLPGGGLHGLDSLERLDGSRFPELDGKLGTGGGTADGEDFWGPEGREPPVFWRPREAARNLGISKETMRVFSRRRSFPPAFNFSRGAKAYKREEILEWAETMRAGPGGPGAG
ncbi:MAG: helix-turn-helix domain-containing protein [Deltaproteobacteria bacterium]|nr:helix-turn-helix domain-containing protein [Deltaproteobacteria bacterium]